jgi:hypothetical protein
LKKRAVDIIKRAVPRLEYPLRARIGMGLIVFFVLLSSFVQFNKDWQEFALNQIGNDGITVYERRFAALKPVLPPNGVIGYVTDAEPYNIEFFLTQYSVAPLMVDPKEGHEFVIGNFANKASNPKTWNGVNLDLRLDLGNGVKLFHSALR